MSISSSIHMWPFTRALIVMWERWLCAPRSEMRFEQGHRLVTGTTTRIQVSSRPSRISPIRLAS